MHCRLARSLSHCSVKVTKEHHDKYRKSWRPWDNGDLFEWVFRSTMESPRKKTVDLYQNSVEKIYCKLSEARLFLAFENCCFSRSGQQGYAVPSAQPTPKHKPPTNRSNTKKVAIMRPLRSFVLINTACVPSSFHPTFKQPSLEDAHTHQKLNQIKPNRNPDRRRKTKSTLYNPI